MGTKYIPKSSFFAFFFCFQPNSRATKSDWPQVSESQPSALLRFEKNFQKKKKKRSNVDSKTKENFQNNCQLWLKN
jgi:hypothetical protein